MSSPPESSAKSKNLEPQDTSTKRIFHLRFRLRSLLIAVAVTGVGLGITAYKLQSYYSQKRIADSFARDGATIEYRYGNVIGVDFSTTKRDASGLRHPAGVPIDSERIRQINDLEHLQWLTFSFTNLDDDLLGEIDGLENLRRLRIDCTDVSSQGIANLNGFPSLEIISVLVDQLDEDSEETLRKRFPEIYVEKYHLFGSTRVVDGFQ